VLYPLPLLFRDSFTATACLCYPLPLLFRDSFTATACLCYPLPFIRALCEPKLCTVTGLIVVLPILYTFYVLSIQGPFSDDEKPQRDPPLFTNQPKAHLDCSLTPPPWPPQGSHKLIEGHSLTDSNHQPHVLYENLFLNDQKPQTIPSLFTNPFQKPKSHL
jgi:hypothetical protein